MPRLEGFLQAGEKGIGARGRPRRREQPGCQALRLFLQGGEGKNTTHPKNPRAGEKKAAHPRGEEAAAFQQNNRRGVREETHKQSPKTEPPLPGEGTHGGSRGPWGPPGAQTPPPGALPRWHELKESSRGLRYLSGKGKGRVRARRGRGTPGRGVPRTESGTGTSVRLRGQPRARWGSGCAAGPRVAKEENKYKTSERERVARGFSPWEESGEVEAPCGTRLLLLLPQLSRLPCSWACVRLSLRCKWWTPILLGLRCGRPKGGLTLLPSPLSS